LQGRHIKQARAQKMPLKGLWKSFERFSPTLQSDNKQMQTQKVFKKHFKHRRRHFENIALVF